MSEEQRKAFLEKVKADTSLQEKLIDEELEEVSGGKGLEFSPEQQDEFEVVAVPISDG